jgi:hypothetical protein
MLQPCRLALAAGLFAGVAAPALATTIKPVGFGEMVDRSALVAQGRAVSVESFWGKGSALKRRASAEKESTSPRRSAESETAAPGAAKAAPGRPVSLPTEGGRMIFTRVRLEVDESIKGDAGSEVEFVVAGGTVDGLTATVEGMPRFEKGNRYLVFLQQGFAETAVPIVGVNQGFFQVVRDENSGEDLLYRSAGVMVTGIEGDRVTTTRVVGAGRPMAARVGAPVPEQKGVSAQAPQAEAARVAPRGLSALALTDAVRARTAQKQ